MATNDAPESSPLMTWNDEIWSPDAGAAHWEDNPVDLRKVLVDKFDDAGDLPGLLMWKQDQWIAFYYRNGNDRPVYWTGTKPPPLPS